MDEPSLTLKTIFDRARELATPEERRAYLNQVCNNVEVRQRVEALLRAYEDDSDDSSEQILPPDALPSTLDTGSDHTPNPTSGRGTDSDERPAPSFEDVGGRIGSYKLLQQVGEGGMGTVFMAEQQEPVRRTVALKIIKAGMDSAQVIARFEAERQALALMDHPNIAKVLDANKTENGRPYFVMEMVKGIPITKYCDEQRLSPRQRLELFVPVCQAIQHAHQKGIIHRDIKPSNVLVVRYDGYPVAKVIDFGVAKAMGQKLTERTLFTGFGGIVGTLPYMSPEQADFNALDIDTRSDVYSLGVLLYELLTGTTPLTRQQLKDVPFTEVLRLIREEEPPRPSARLSATRDSLTSLSAQRRMEPTTLLKALRGEVDWIVMKALEKDRTRRYETASSLARDIQRYLADEPVEAGPPTTGYRLRKLAWKYRRGLMTATALLLLVVASAVVSSCLAFWAIRAEKQARNAEGIANQERDKALAAEKTANDQRDKALAAEKDAEEQRDKAVAAEEDTRAVLSFFQQKVLSAGRPEGQEGGMGNQVTLHQAVDAAEPGIARAFVSRPLVEASIRNTLGETYRYLGEYREAIRQHERALALRESKLGPDHPDTLIARNNLANAYWSVHRNADAVRLYEQNLKQYETQFGPNHPYTLEASNNLAQAYRDTGRIADAIRLHERNLKQFEAKFGVNDPHTLMSRNNLAYAYHSAGRYAEAIPLFERNLKQFEFKRGADHPDTLTARNNLAVAYRDASRIADTIRLLELNLTYMPDKLGPNHPYTFASRNNLALAYDLAGELAKSEALYRSILEQTRKHYGAEHEETANEMVLLAANLLHQHKYAEAETQLRASLKLREARQPDEWATFNTRSMLGEALLGQKRFTEAEPLLLSGYEGLKQREKSIPRESKSGLTEAAGRLVQLYEAMGKKDEAEKWRKQWEQIHPESTEKSIKK